MPGMNAGEMTQMFPGVTPTRRPQRPQGSDLRPLDRIVPLAARLRVPRPIWVAAPGPEDQDWTISSQVQNRPQRVTYAVTPRNGAIVGKSGFAQESAIDKVVNVAIASHEGQLFGRPNQAILLLNAISVLMVSAARWLCGGVADRRTTWGAPVPEARPRFSALLLAAIAILAVLVPLFALSLAVVLGLELMVLRRHAAARHWLGLRAGPDDGTMMFRMLP